MNKKDQILNEALKLMNERGIEGVSTYDIAKILDMRQSNITYYFATKAAIINALGKKMIEDVNTTFATAGPARPEDFSLAVFYEMLDAVMKVHQRYKCILMSFAPVICSDKELNDHFITILKGRQAEFDGLMALLDANGYIHGKEILKDSNTIMLMQNMLAIYWIQEAEIYLPGQSQKAKRRHHLRIFFQTYVPYATEKGKKQLDMLFSGEWKGTGKILNTTSNSV
jgi:AcrR family transcriptional regulator